jgi:hypothetical protein
MKEISFVFFDIFYPDVKIQPWRLMMSSEEKSKNNAKRETNFPKNDPIEEGISALEELFIETFKIDPADPRLKKVMDGYRALVRKVSEIDRRGVYYSDEIYMVKQKMNKHE